MLRQLEHRYSIDAGPHLMAKEFRYFQILIVKTAIHHFSVNNYVFYNILFSLQYVALGRVHNLYKYY